MKSMNQVKCIYRVLSILKKLERGGEYNIQVLSLCYGLSTRQVLRDLNILIEAGFVRRIGISRAVRYAARRTTGGNHEGY